MKTPNEFKKWFLTESMNGKVPTWSGAEINECHFSSMNLGGKLDVVLASGTKINVDMDEIKFK